MFKLSENVNLNYVATICKITELFPIENSDNLLRTVVNGFDIVVDKSTKVGDTVVYFPTECAICPEFLSVNNLFEFTERERNANYAEVEVALAECNEIKDDAERNERFKEIRRMAGFFNKHGRVRAINLRGCPSLGFLAKPELFERMFPNVTFDWENNIGVQFDTVDDVRFVKKYVPNIPVARSGNGGGKTKKQKALKRFDRLVEGQFEFHPDTTFLNVNMWRFNADSKVSITKKIHGTSAIFCNILVNRKLSLWEKVKKFFGANVKLTEYGNVYSSRGVIKNRYINKDVNGGFYGTDVWGYINEIIKPFIPEGMSVYGEIMGYVPGTDKFIQKGHDYGCAVGECKFMPYRITTTDELGNKVEWDVDKVNEWTETLMSENPNIAKYFMPMVIFHFGRFGDLYPEVDPSDHWNENVLALMKLDKRFDMEEDEPLCTLYNDEIAALESALNALKDAKASKKAIKAAEKTLAETKAKKAPAEGIVVRPVGTNTSDAYKLKTDRHYGKETEANDAGEVDMETLESEGGSDVE